MPDLSLSGVRTARAPMLRSKTIQGVFFDFGGVLEAMAPGQAVFSKGVTAVTRVLQQRGVNLGRDRLEHLLRQGMDAYGEWTARNDYRELPPDRIWIDFYLRGLPAEQYEALGDAYEELGSVLELHLFKRRPARSLVPVLSTLYRNRFVMGVVSNTISMTLIPERLRTYGVDRYISVLLLSIAAGVRKPHPLIFQEACARAGLEPGRTMFIGDTSSRDVEGARRAGFGRVVLLRSGVTDLKDRGYRGTSRPDQVIESLDQVVDLLRG
ncbi:MAG: HAD family hydrolase [Spirochaetota bacterium]